MKFGQLIECNMKTIFLEKLCTECDGEAIPRPFSYKSRLRISLDLYLKSDTVVLTFLLCTKVRAIKIYQSFKRQSYKIEIADESFECVWPF